jgi:hypothetical protein
MKRIPQSSSGSKQGRVGGDIDFFDDFEWWMVAVFPPPNEQTY